MTKEWLIRTQHKQILGPVSKKKILELIEKGSLLDEDELTCGNGYWFFIKEKDLLDRFVYGDEKQTFNPISEAKDVLSSGSKSSAPAETASESSSVDDTKMINLDMVPPADAGEDNVEASNGAVPGDDDLEYPDLGEVDKKKT